MTVRKAIEDRLASGPSGDDEGPAFQLASVIKRDASVKVGMLKRLSSSKRFSYGARSGALATAARRSGSAFRLDVRQRVIVKALVSRHLGSGAARGKALATHVRYLGREGAGQEGEAGTFFDRAGDAVDGRERIGGWSAHRHHFRFIVSPEHGDRIADLRDYTRDVMGRVCADLGEPDLPWMAVCHFDTDQPHAHVLVSGRRANGQDLVIPRDYIAYGFRARAQEAAQERLGDLSRLDAERRIWRETQRAGFTGFDRRLIASADAEGLVADAAGEKGAWSALTRGRLAHLEALGLAERQGRMFRLDQDLEGKLRRLQVSQDIIRTINQRRLETGRSVEILQGEVRGRIVKAGHHDELGASPYAVIQDSAGVEHYARLGTGSALPAAGAEVSLAVDGRGVARVAQTLGRGGSSLEL